MSDSDINKKQAVPGLSSSPGGTAASTEPHKAEQSLIASPEERLRLILDYASDGIYGADTNGICTFVNKACLRMLGYEREEDLVGKRIHALIHHTYPDGRPYPMENCHVRLSTVEGKTTHIEDEVHWRPDGTSFPVEYRSHPMYRDGELVGAVVTFTDITERKLAEAELDRYKHHLEQLVEERTAALSVAKETAEAANRAKNTFLANMSHELRTPMNAIMGMNELARRHAADSKLIDKLDKIDQASKHLLAIINDILDITRIEAERLSLEQVGFKVGDILENLKGLIGHNAANKGLRMIFDLRPEIASLSLLGDPLRLGQILLNLAGNAVKFTEAGTISVLTRLAGENPTDILLRFEVRDTGIGISSEDQKRLFTAFEQADGSMTRKYGGTGLGLAISKRLAQMMGGEIGVESQVGAGSTFWFTARLVKAVCDVAPAWGRRADSAEAQLKARFAGARILVAEDEPINREVSRGLLEEVGLTVDLAEDGAEAVEMAQRTHYDLILMDMQMPKLNGVDATRAIRALSGLDHVPILAMTANAFDEDRQKCIEAGMNGHMAKPIEPDRLFETVLNLLARP